jgi:hypothetical protein
MRRRILLLTIVAGGLAAVGGAAAGVGVATSHDTTESVALTRADLVDVPAPALLSRTRDALTRERDGRRDVAAALATAVALTLTVGWWLARERRSPRRHRVVLASPRTRAPPLVPATVHS